MTPSDMIVQARPLLTVFVFVFGACVGSFLNVCIWRLPRGESLVHPGSHCPRCGHAIRPWENVPLLSWLLLRGRCSACGGGISIRYPLIEGLTALAFTGVWLRYTALPGVPWQALPGAWFLTAVCIAAAIIDAEHRIIPDRLTIPSLIAAFALALILPEGRMIGGWFQAGAFPSHFWTLTALEQISGIFPAAAESVRVQAMVDAAIGAGIGAGFLLLVRETARLLTGATTHGFPEPAPFTISSDGLRFGDDPTRTWRDLSPSRRNPVVLEVHEGRLTVRRARSKEDDRDQETIGLSDVPVRITDRWILLPDRRIERSALVQMTGRCRKVRVPREVLGLGDVKMHAVIGGFLGPEAAMMVAFMAGVLGVAWVLGRRLVAPSRPALPFGPFLALAAWLWIMAAGPVTEAIGAGFTPFYRVRPSPSRELRGEHAALEGGNRRSPLMTFPAGRLRVPHPDLLAGGDLTIAVHEACFHMVRLQKFR